MLPELLLSTQRLDKTSDLKLCYKHVTLALTAEELLLRPSSQECPRNSCEKAKEDTRSLICSLIPGVFISSPRSH